MTDGYTVACLVPRPTDWQQVVESVVQLEPPPSEHDSYLDAFGNLVHEFGVHELHGALDDHGAQRGRARRPDAARGRHGVGGRGGAARRGTRGPGVSAGLLPVGVDVRRSRRPRCRAAEHRRPLVHPRTVDRRCHARAVPRHRRVVPVRRRVLRRVDAVAARARGAARRVPGLRPSGGRLPALDRVGGAVRERLHRDGGAAGPGAAGRCRRLARVVLGVDADRPAGSTSIRRTG